MGSKENNQALVRPSNFQGKRRSRTPGCKFNVRELGVGRLCRIIDQRLRDVHNITRKECPRRFAQFLQQQPKETKELSVSSFAANPKAVENIEDEACDAHVPMVVKHTEEEDENVEDEDPIMDIDSSGSKDPLNVVEHIDDIYAHYGKTEQKCKADETLD